MFKRNGAGHERVGHTLAKIWYKIFAQCIIAIRLRFDGIFSDPDIAVGRMRAYVYVCPCLCFSL